MLFISFEQNKGVGIIYRWCHMQSVTDSESNLTTPPVQRSQPFKLASRVLGSSLSQLKLKWPWPLATEPVCLAFSIYGWSTAAKSTCRTQCRPSMFGASFELLDLIWFLCCRQKIWEALACAGGGVAGLDEISIPSSAVAPRGAGLITMTVCHLPKCEVRVWNTHLQVAMATFTSLNVVFCMQVQTALKPSRVLQLCSKHERKKQQFQAQAAKAGKAEELSQMEDSDTMRYLELFEAYCTSSEMRGRPCEAKKFDWSVITSQTSGVRDSCETVSEYLCDIDYVHYYMHKAPGYERALAIVILLFFDGVSCQFCLFMSLHMLHFASSNFAVISFHLISCT